MKRSNDALQDETDRKPSKQPRLEQQSTAESAFNFDDPSLKIEASSIADAVDEEKWFSAPCKMRWAKSARNRRYQFEVGGGLKMEVELCGPEVIADSFKPDVEIEDVVQFSLRGASLKKKSASSHLPFTLVYKDGVLFRIVGSIANPAKVGLVFDAWKRESSVSMSLYKRLIPAST